MSPTRGLQKLGAICLKPRKKNLCRVMKAHLLTEGLQERIYLLTEGLQEKKGSRFPKRYRLTTMVPQRISFMKLGNLMRVPPQRSVFPTTKKDRHRMESFIVTIAAKESNWIRTGCLIQSTPTEYGKEWAEDPRVQKASHRKYGISCGRC
jgi:hypothetical protein